MAQLYDPPKVADVPSYFDFGFLPPAGTYFSLGNRVYLVKAIVNPQDSTVSVNIPVLVRSPSTDAGLQFWESDWTFDPVDGGSGTRSFRVETVYNTGDLDIGGSNANADPTQTLDVERVDSFTRNVASDDPYAGGGMTWEYEMQFDNVTGEGDQNTPAHFLHAATHPARWYQSDGAGNVVDSTVFVDSEYVDGVDYQQNDDGKAGALFNQEYGHTLRYGWFNASDGAGGFLTTSNPQPIVMDD